MPVGIYDASRLSSIVVHCFSPLLMRKMQELPNRRILVFVASATNVMQRNSSFLGDTPTRECLCNATDWELKGLRSSSIVCMSYMLSRRQFVRAFICSKAVVSEIVTPAWAEGLPSPFTSPDNLIARLAQKAPPRPQAKLFERDIFYPDFFTGVWATESELVSVTCPAGYKLFGRPGSFESAQKEINKSMRYRSRFVRVGHHVIADRVFNVKAIAEATMGSQSVLECDLSSNNPDMFLATIRPNSADGNVFVVRMKALSRQQQDGPLPTKLGDPDAMFAFNFESLTAKSSEVVDTTSFSFYTSEMVRQEVRVDTEDLRIAPSIKEIETTTLFITSPLDENYIQAWQRTSSYLTRSNLKFVDTRGLPTDVRWYRLKYSREARRRT